MPAVPPDPRRPSDVPPWPDVPSAPVVPHRRMSRAKIWAVGTFTAVVVIGLATVAWGLSQTAGRSAAGLSISGDGIPSASDPSAMPSGSASAGPGASASASARPSRSPSATSSPRRTSGPVVIGPPVGGPWPNPSNTGIPAGTKLSTYTGSCTITAANTVIDAKTVNCNTLSIKAANVTIKRSKINGGVNLDTDISGSRNWSYTLVDSEVNAGLRQLPAVSYGNMTIRRSNISGGQTSVQCGEHAVSCTIEDSYLHGQRIPDNTNWHLGGFLSNGGHTIRIRHNTIICDAPVNNRGEGCTGDLNLFGDFAVISDVVVDSNFLGANTGSSYCLYGGSALSKPYPRADHVVITNNVFQRGTNRKCGAYGPVSSFDRNGVGNVWSNNKWDDGAAVGGEM